MLSGNLTSATPDPAKAFVPILFSPSLILIFFNAIQFSKQLSPISIIPSGSSISLSLELFINTAFAITFVESLTLTLSFKPLLYKSTFPKYIEPYSSTILLLKASVPPNTFSPTLSIPSDILTVDKLLQL